MIHHLQTMEILNFLSLIFHHLIPFLLIPILWNKRIFNSNIPWNIASSWTFGYATSLILLRHLAKARHNQIFLCLTHAYLWIIRHRFLALSGLRCLMTCHRSSSAFSQVWLYGVIESYTWVISSCASWILEGILCHIAYLWVTNPMHFPPMPIIKWAFLLSFSIS